MKNLKIKTKDNINIALNYYKNDKNDVVILSPGWCMTKDSNAFKNIAESFIDYYDVISFDFRGHGESDGFYTFSAIELMDIDAVVRFARKNNYKNIYLMGFSLGAAISIIYASKSIFVNKVIAVSPPADFNQIENKMWKKEAWAETFKKFELGRFSSIRPYPFPLKKTKPEDVVEKIKAPTLFMAGEKDPTVCSWHTEVLFNKAICPKKYKLYKNGFHAEDLFLYFKEDFTTTCLEWLNMEHD